MAIPARPQRLSQLDNYLRSDKHMHMDNTSSDSLARAGIFDSESGSTQQAFRYYTKHVIECVDQQADRTQGPRVSNGRREVDNKKESEWLSEQWRLRKTALWWKMMAIEKQCRSMNSKLRNLFSKIPFTANKCFVR